MKNSFLANFLEMMISFFKPNFDISKHPYIVIFFRGIFLVLIIFIFHTFFTIIFLEITVKVIIENLFFGVFIGSIVGLGFCILEFLFKDK
jgi:hypothetical protein